VGERDLGSHIGLALIWSHSFTKNTWSKGERRMERGKWGRKMSKCP
jgi:hypothetical protein